ncbi:hypothetical protein GCM10011529_27530 [Polymorphobacter glacialis]|uniref:Uncharacterized protein n=1 Tax=Sandarakinorhabdus glacialis TaxID=1614636 RepID=A0A917EAJ8_9SPHN|nr:hypothetical protein GCM10011529_27530 [Polymorphobacter glacialis]
MVDAAVFEIDYDAARARIKRVFDKFLERRRGAFDHLARRDLVDESIGKAADERHGAGLGFDRGGVT